MMTSDGSICKVDDELEVGSIGREGIEDIGVRMTIGRDKGTIRC